MVNKTKVQQAHDDLVRLGDLTVRFANVHRSTLYPDGHYENDAEHSFHLALSATEIAASYHPELDVGLVSQFSIVHDLAEIYAGDVPSYKLNDDERAKKEIAEKNSPREASEGIAFLYRRSTLTLRGAKRARG